MGGSSMLRYQKLMRRANDFDDGKERKRNSDDVMLCMLNVLFCAHVRSVCFVVNECLCCSVLLVYPFSNEPVCSVLSSDSVNKCINVVSYSCFLYAVIITKIRFLIEK